MMRDHVEILPFDLSIPWPDFNKITEDHLGALQDSCLDEKTSTPVLPNKSQQTRQRGRKGKNRKSMTFVDFGGGRSVSFSRGLEQLTSRQMDKGNSFQRIHNTVLQNPSPECFITSPLHKPSQKQSNSIFSQHSSHQPVLKMKQRYGIYSLYSSKGKGIWRAILDLKFLNKFVKLGHFIAETLHSITESLQLQEYLLGIDLLQRLTSISQSSGGPGDFWIFVKETNPFNSGALPLGLLTVPRVFSAVLIKLDVHLREKGIHIHPYLAPEPCLYRTWKDPTVPSKIWIHKRGTAKKKKVA